MINVGIHSCSPVVAAGIRALLLTRPGEVHVARPGQRVDVLLYDLVTARGPLTLPDSSVPIVALLREGDANATALCLTAESPVVTVDYQVDGRQLVETVKSALRARQQPDAPTSATPTCPEDRVLPLSGRERQVIAFVCAGMSNQEIADRLYLTLNTVKTHIRSCYRKTGVKTRAQAVRWGMEHGYGHDLTST